MPPDSLEASVRRDLVALSRMAHRADDDAMREASVQVRRLLIDNTLARLRRSAGSKGEVRIRALDISSLNASAIRSKVVMAMAGGALIEGVGVFAGFVLNEGAQPLGGGVPRDYPLTAYLDSPCAMIRLQGGPVVASATNVLEMVSRRSLIKYVANKLGGIHFDERRDPQSERAFILLDQAMASSILPAPPTSNTSRGPTGSLFGMTYAFWELLAVVQSLVASPTVMETVGLEPVPHPLDAMRSDD